jgi:hypothetical protein
MYVYCGAGGGAKCRRARIRRAGTHSLAVWEVARVVTGEGRGKTVGNRHHQERQVGRGEGGEEKQRAKQRARLR